MVEYMPTDKQYNGQLIEEYQRLERILEVAQKENSTETIAILKKEMKYIELKLQPIQLPNSGDQEIQRTYQN